MQVFRVYFKVIKKNLVMLSVYIFVFVAMAFAFTLIGGGGASAAADFTESKCPIAVFNEDGGSELTAGLVAFIGQNSVQVALEDSPEAIQDALFFRKVEYILRIPAGFADAFMANGDVKLTKTAVPDSTSAVYMDMLIGNYLNTAKLYVLGAEGIGQAEIAEKAALDLAQETEVTVRSKAVDLSAFSSIASFFNFSAYSILAVLILGVSAFMLVFNKPELRRRNLCSPLSARSISIQSLCGNLVFALLVYSLLVVCALILHGTELLTLNGLLWFANLLIFLLVALSLSYLLASIIKNRSAQNAAANTVALGMSFLSGVFVPQYLLSGTVNTIASFMPAYWFVKANNEIASIASFNWENLSSIFACYLIELGFAAVLLAVTFIVTRQKKNSNKEPGAAVQAAK